MKKIEPARKGSNFETNQKRSKLNCVIKDGLPNGKHIPSVLDDFTVKPVIINDAINPPINNNQGQLVKTGPSSFNKVDSQRIIKKDNSTKSSFQPKTPDNTNNGNVKKSKKKYSNQNISIRTGKAANKVVAVKSDCPTALIAPSDFVHIFNNNNDAIHNNGNAVAKTPLLIKSGCPTALIAPSDYVHVYNNTYGCEKTVLPIKSDCPTALIAPSDFVHIFNNNTNDNIRNNIIIKKANANLTEKAPLVTKSDSAAALIAPSDYVHVYKNLEPIAIAAPLKAKSDCPTALIAPSDFVHVYANQDIPKKGPVVIKSNCPTTLIAPSDYVHVYKNLEHKASQAHLQVKSDCPTALIAPDDYMHIYNNRESKQKQQVSPNSQGTSQTITINQNGARTPKVTVKITKYNKDEQDVPINSDTKKNFQQKQMQGAKQRIILVRSGLPESLIEAIEKFIKTK